MWSALKHRSKASLFLHFLVLIHLYFLKKTKEINIMYGLNKFCFNHNQFMWNIHLCGSLKPFPLKCSMGDLGFSVEQRKVIVPVALFFLNYFAYDVLVKLLNMLVFQFFLGCTQVRYFVCLLNIRLRPCSNGKESRNELEHFEVQVCNAVHGCTHMHSWKFRAYAHLFIKYFLWTHVFSTLSLDNDKPCNYR